MTKIHYISCHSVLEYDEVKLLTDLGYEVYSNGAYRDPRGAYTLPRPGIPNAPIDERFMELTAIHPKTELPPELIDPYDVIIIMHSPEVLFNNWPRIKHKRVIWRTIGQSLPHIEQRVQGLVAEGLQIVRYSAMERNLLNFAGENTTIYFYKDPNEFTGWTGFDKRPINFSQSLLGRRYFCHYDEISEAFAPFPGAKVYGSGNDDLGHLNGGDVPYEHMKGLMRDCGAYLYAGTWPASYTLSLIEAMMTGIPVVAIGTKLAETDRFEGFHFYEVPNFIENGLNGFIGDTVEELQRYLRMLLDDPILAKKIGDNGRKTAIGKFGRDRIGEEWKRFLG
jgi:hypothetical protein